MGQYDQPNVGQLKNSPAVKKYVVEHDYNNCGYLKLRSGLGQNLNALFQQKSYLRLKRVCVSVYPCRVVK